MTKFKTISLTVLKMLALLIFLAYFLIWILSPLAAEYLISSLLQPHGLTLGKQTHIRYNPFQTHLSVEDFAIVDSASQAVLSLESAELELDLYRLAVDEIHIDTLTLTGLYIASEILEQQMKVAGFTLPQSPGETGASVATEEPEKDPAATATSTFNYTITAPEITLSNSTFSVNNLGNKHTFSLNNLQISETKLNPMHQGLAVTIAGNMFGGEVKLVSTVGLQDAAGSIDSTLSIKGLQLAMLEPELASYLDMLSGTLNAELYPKLGLNNNDIALDLSGSKLQLENLGLIENARNTQVTQLTVTLPTAHILATDDGSMSIALDQSKLEIKGLELEEPARSTQLAHFELELTEARIQTNDGGLQSLNTLANTSLTSLRVNNLKSGDMLLDLGALSASSLKLMAEQDFANSLTLSVAQLSFSNTNVSQVHHETQDIPTLLHIDDILLEKIRWAQNQVALDEVLISGIQSDVQIAADKSILTLSAFSDDTSESDSAISASETTISENETAATTESEAQASTTDADAAPSEPPQAMSLSLARLSIEGENTLRFVDKSVSPTYRRTLYIDKFVIQNIDNQSQTLSPFEFVGRSDEYSKIDFTGGVAPFGETINATLKGNLNEVSLPSISSYIREPLGFELKSGELDTALEVQVKESQLNGKVKLHMRGITMSAAETLDKANLKGQTAVPLNVALGMLKDDKGNIKLDVPLSGSINDPAFGISNFIALATKKAVLSQAKSYLMQTFVPYATVVSVAISAGEFALKLRFEDLLYAAGETAVGPEQVAYADQFSALLNDKSKAQVKVCGVATAADLKEDSQLRPEDEESLDILRTIAKLRAENFKKYAVENGGIASFRILVCAPKLDFSDNAKPRISISI